MKTGYRMATINHYQTKIGALHLFISHGKEGTTNCSYGVISDDGKRMVEFEPRHGPFTLIESEDVLNDYLNHRTKRGNWRQREFDDSLVHEYLQKGEFQYLVNMVNIEYPQLNPQ